MALFAAMLFDTFDKGVVRIALFVLLVVISTYALILQAKRSTPVYVWCAWEGIANDIVSKTPETEKAKIYAFENLVAYHVWFTMRASNRTAITAVKGVEGMHEDESYFLPRGFDEVERASVENVNADRAWLLFRTEKPGQEATLLRKVREQGYSTCPNVSRRFGLTDIHVIEVVRTGSCSEADP
jgi:hypothetical protein